MTSTQVEGLRIEREDKILGRSIKRLVGAAERGKEASWFIYVGLRMDIATEEEKFLWSTALGDAF